MSAKFRACFKAARAGQRESSMSRRVVRVIGFNARQCMGRRTRSQWGEEIPIPTITIDSAAPTGI